MKFQYCKNCAKHPKIKYVSEKALEKRKEKAEKKKQQEDSEKCESQEESEKEESQEESEKDESEEGSEKEESQEESEKENLPKEVELERGRQEFEKEKKAWKKEKEKKLEKERRQKQKEIKRVEELYQNRLECKEEKIADLKIQVEKLKQKLQLYEEPPRVSCFFPPPPSFFVSIYSSFFFFQVLPTHFKSMINVFIVAIGHRKIMMRILIHTWFLSFVLLFFFFHQKTKQNKQTQGLQQ